MVCPSCQAENRPDRKFCAQCGIALAAACPSCGAANQAGERFCGECGTALTGVPASRAAAGQPAVPPAAERRLVSVLFADLVGFTSLSRNETRRRRSPPDLHAPWGEADASAPGEDWARLEGDLSADLAGVTELQTRRGLEVTAVSSDQHEFSLESRRSYQSVRRSETSGTP